MPLRVIPEEEVIETKRVPRKLEGLEVEEILKVPKKRPAELLLGIVQARKPELIGGRPVIPTDNPCCANVCRIINNTIDTKDRTLGKIIKMGGYVEYQKYRQLVYETEALKEHRALLKTSNACNCVEPVIQPVSIIPIINGRPIGATPIITEKPTGEKRKKTPKEHLMEMALHRAPVPKKVRERHATEISIPATQDSCCPITCDIINKEIDKTDLILDTIELRGAFQRDLYKTQRYEALAYKANALKDYRSDLRSACKCVEYKIKQFIPR